MNREFLTLEEVVVMHDAAVHEFGGTSGIRDMSRATWPSSATVVKPLSPRSAMPEEFLADGLPRVAPSA